MKHILQTVLVLFLLSIFVCKFSATPPVTICQQGSNATGLVALYHINEGTGQTVNDASGNGLTGTSANETWTTGKFSNGISYNGTDTSLLVDDSDLLDPASITLAGWFNTNNLNQTMYLFGKFKSVIKKGYAFYSNLIGWIYWQGGDGSSWPAWNINTGSSVLDDSVGWQFIVGTLSATASVIYVNGVAVQSGAGATLSGSSQKLQIGSGTDGSDTPSQLFRGIADEVSIYDRALSAAEVYDIYHKQVTITSIKTFLKLPVGRYMVSFSGV